MSKLELRNWLINEAKRHYEKAMNAADPVMQEIWWQHAIHDMDAADGILFD